MDEHIAASAPFKGVHLNTSYSYGIDDQDFVVAFDSDYPQEFVDLVGRLRYTEASLYTQRDTPMFACAQGADRRDPRAVGEHGLTRGARGCTDGGLGVESAHSTVDVVRIRSRRRPGVVIER